MFKKPGTDKKVKKAIRETQRAEKAIISGIASVIKKAVTAATPEAWRLKARQVEKEALAWINGLLDGIAAKAGAVIRNIFEAAAEYAIRKNEPLYKALGKVCPPLRERQDLQRLIMALSTQTAEQFKNYTKTAGFVLRDPVSGKLKPTPMHDVLTGYLDDAVMQLLYGEKDPGVVMNEVVNNLTDSGVRTIDYASGRSDRLDTAVRRAIYTGMNQITAAVQEQDAAILGTDKFEVEWHEGARPTHQVWQGRVYSKEQLHTVCGLGTATGLCGINCYHTYYPFVEGISKRLYTEEWLQNKTAEEETPKKYPTTGREFTVYEAKQHQRHLELLLRVTEERVEALRAAGADKRHLTTAEARLMTLESRYRTFSQVMDLPAEWERLDIRRPRHKKKP